MVIGDAAAITPPYPGKKNGTTPPPGAPTAPAAAGGSFIWNGGNTIDCGAVAAGVTEPAEPLSLSTKVI
jgi:hypothetical protein